MTAITLPRAFIYPPGFFDTNDSGPAIGVEATVDAAGEYVAYVMQAREDMTISHVVWRCGGATGSPTADIRIETVDAAGLPSGTLWAANTNIVTGALSIATRLDALTASASISRSQHFAVVIKYNSGTNITIHALTRLMANADNARLYRVINIGTPTKSGAACPIIGLGSSATSFYNLYSCLPISAVTISTFNNTNSEARGLRFKLPFDTRLVGVTAYLITDLGDYNVACYDDAGTELSSSLTAFDGDHQAGIFPGFSGRFFDNPVLLTRDTWYRVALAPTTATNVRFYTLTVASADYLGASPWTTVGHYTTRVSGVWDDSNTLLLPVMNLLIDQIDDGAGAGAGGGLLAHPGMRGGFV